MSEVKNISVKILIVDDRKENILLIKHSLGELNHTLIGASSGKEALQLMMEQDFAVVLLDVQMPIMTGLEVAEEMKKISKTKHIPIIFITAIINDETTIMKGYKSGAIDYICKPFSSYVLTCKVRIFCELYRQRQFILQQEQELEERHKVLEKHLEEIDCLRGLLPICSHCKSIRDVDGYWSDIEDYLEKNSKITFSHGLCTNCIKELYPDQYNKLLASGSISPIKDD